MLKKIRIKDELFAFDSETFDFFEVTEKDEITEKGESIGNDNEEEKKSDVFNDSGLNRLTLNMSNMCNLNCKYCYANGGNYNRPNKIMSRESFNNILNDLKNRNIKKIREVKFFGGEPTINNNLIVEALEILSKDYDVDKYMIVTNGTLLTKDFITECLKYNCYFAISLDGPEDINDFLRGKETFNTVINNLNSLFDDTFKKRVELLCTFTPYHLKNGYSKETLSNFFKELGFKYTITKVGSDKVDFKFIEQNSTVDVFNDIDKSLNCILKNTDDKNINSYVYEFMLAIAYGQKALKFCDELIEDFNLSYDYNGDPYICYRFWGKNEYNLNNKGYRSSYDKINNKNNKLKCKSCWAKNICILCPANVLEGAIDKELGVYDCNCKKEIYYEYILKNFIGLIIDGKSDILIQNFESFVKVV